MTKVCLALNAGSSSLKFRLFAFADQDERTAIFQGLYERLGAAARFCVRGPRSEVIEEANWPEQAGFGHEQALLHLIGWLQAHREDRELVAIGHRIAHGGADFDGPTIIDASVLDRLAALSPLAPLHQPFNLAPVRTALERMPHIPQVGCFDTSFHLTQPKVASVLALPAAIRERGVRRYGFHGLSYAYIASELARREPALARARVVVAHLGSGSSLCALQNGVSVATTMGFSALDGVPMGTRCGALDPGAIIFMLRDIGMTIGEVERLLYTKSGLLGLSGVSNDMRALRQAAAQQDANARLAIDHFTYRIRREIGSLAAAMGGVDAIVFTAGIGENDVATRAEVLEGLSWLGFELDRAANDAGGPRITRPGGRPAFVLPTSEEIVIARQIRACLGAHAATAALA